MTERTHDMSGARAADSDPEVGETRAANGDAPYMIEEPQIEQEQQPARASNEVSEDHDPLTDTFKHEDTGPTDRTHTEQQGSSAGNGTLRRSFDPAEVRSQNEEPRRTLHLSLPPDRDALGTGQRFATSPAGTQREGLVDAIRSSTAQDGPVTVSAMGEPKTKEGAAFIDQALRDRVDGDITAFLAAFDAALAEDTPESRADLRDATDRLLRAGARTRIELERLEARVPLSSPRDDSRHPAQPWRSR
jgi:hypothetical protein